MALVATARGGDANSGGLVVFPTLFMILFRRKYPRWWFDWNLLFLRFSTRVVAYAFLLITDRYPPHSPSTRNRLLIRRT